MPQLSSTEQKAKQEQTFQTAFSQLNDAQKEAVQHIEGPLFVLAGPGTGKTQILALRIGYILQHTDTKPHNILCLTYTDAGTIAMRKRLFEFIGSAAYNVHIFTFHAFTNQVIQDNMHLFSGVKELQPLSDIEKSEVFTELIDKIPNDNPLKRFKGEVYYDTKRLANLFDAMKKEGWTVEYVLQQTDAFLMEERENPKYIYKRKSTKNGKTYLKGDLKEADYNKLVDDMEKFKAAAVLFKAYQDLLKEKGRYDYHDMILWVLEKFESNEHLLLRYQEQYLYFLVDEYQDTNGVQNKVLEKLADYWENPNVFAVGDDDQSIFRFQGANMENITDFIDKYNPKVVVLTENYRSSQKILNAAANLIAHNQKRLVNSLEISKDIRAAGDNAALDIPVEIRRYANPSQEETGIYLEIKKMLADGYPLNKAAIIYRKHKQVENLIKVLESQNIPINVKRKVNILTEAFIINIIQILQYIQSEYKETGSREDLLFKTLVAPVFGINYADIIRIGRLAGYNRDKKKNKSWLEVIGDKNGMIGQGIVEYEKISGIYEILTNWLMYAPTVTLQVLFEKIITESGMLREALTASDRNWKMQLLNTLFDFIKEESVRNPFITLAGFLETIDKMKQSDIPLPLMRIISAKEGIHFITAHSSKGLEFEKVFLIGAQSDNWESQRAPAFHFKYPENLSGNASDSREEDERRVFFVASTRAEKELVLTYPMAKDDEKELEMSRYVAEMMETPQGVEQVSPEITADQLISFKGQAMEATRLPKASLVDDELIDQVLENFQMSVTALNKYLRCPITFYYENIIRVPFARNANAGFGSAVHYALEYFFREKSKKEGLGSAKLLVAFFAKGMHIYRSHFTDKEFNRLMHYGEQILNAYHAHELKSWFQADDFKVEHHINNVLFRDVPIKGVIDKIEFYKDSVHVIDYKTGKPQNAFKKMNPPKKEDDPGGDYWRQIVFYKMLLDNDPKNNWMVTSGEINLVEPNDQKQYIKRKIVLTPDDLKIVGDQLVEVYQKINKHEFLEGCGDKHCMWCNFVSRKP